MKIAGTPKDVIKLCHATVGCLVMLVSAQLEVDDEPFLVCATPDKGRRAARPGMSHGLYDDERHLFLVSMKTGLMREAPNLSSRVIIFREAEVQLGSESPRGALAALADERRAMKVGEEAPQMTAEQCLADFVATFSPSTGPERLCFERAQQHLASSGALVA
ncbi:hypothetical protein [Ottowia sp.]|uniref:hypothetical protein n=1 Tax=Ottowia sp. TaxID=1898956 RepID=UPI0025E09E98|nr:hypothetical protein [Ottowia sp.]MBK6616459.1 hypothetical protein [Ottowia sp.]